MIKVTYILSFVDQATFFENTFRLIDKSKIELSIILLNPDKSRMEEVAAEENLKFKWIKYSGKKDLISAFFKTLGFLRKVRPDMVHIHLSDAAMVGLPAAILAGVKRRIHTRHGGSQKFFFDKGKKYDRFNNKLSTHIVATCENVKRVLMEEDGVAAKKISIVNLAFETEKFEEKNINKGILKTLQEKYNPNKRGPVVGVISRFSGYKGIQYIIPAYQEFLKSYPNALLILANARGNYVKEVNEMLKPFPPEQVTVIPFEKNFYELYHLFDMFVHVPIGREYEAFGQIYVEAMAASIPCVVTMAGIALEIVKDDYNAIVVDYKNSEQITKALLALSTDKGLRQKLIQNGRTTVDKRFEYKRYISELESLYTRIYKREI